MDNDYLSGGTMRICPYANSPEIITFSNGSIGKEFDRTQCPHHSECTDDSCPLCKHLKN